MKSYRLLFALIMIFNLSENSIAAEDVKKKTGRSSASSSSEKNGYSGAALDLNTSKLPRRYTGNDFVKIYRACRDNAYRFVKTEFENNQQFEKRRDNLRVSPLSEKLRYSDKLAYSKKFMDGDFTVFFILDYISDSFIARNPALRKLVDELKTNGGERTALKYDAEEGVATITLGAPILFDSIKKSSYKATNALGAIVNVINAEGTARFIY